MGRTTKLTMNIGQMWNNAAPSAPISPQNAVATMAITFASEAVILIFVCFGYGFAKFIFPADIAFLVVCACFLIDQMIFSVSMARATYMKKIALQPDHIQPALTAAVTIDHVFSITAALVGGVVWNAFGFQYVFLLGMGIAILNFFTALRVRLPQKNTA